MAPSHSREARRSALGANDEPRGDLVADRDHLEIGTTQANTQDQPRSQRGLNAGERQYLQTRAESLAAQIRGYWLELGVGANVFVEQVSFGRYPEFVVRSSLRPIASPDEVRR